MQPATDRRIVLVQRRTRLEDLVARYNTLAQAKFYVEHLGADFSDYQREHSTYRAAATATAGALGRLGRLHVIDRSFLPNYLFGPQDVVVALGQDGLVANTMKYLNGLPLVGVNPDPRRWDGVLLPFQVKDLGSLMPEVLADARKTAHITFARASLTNGETLLAVNDLFVGIRSHASARYEIATGGRQEFQSSSGLIVSTGLGSTGWLKSILTGAAGISAAAQGRGANPENAWKPMPWDAGELVFSVREPFPSRSSQATMVFGSVSAENPLLLTSAMPENGVIFSDGMESDFVQFNSGATATITVVPDAGKLVI
jgi:NAD kinase